MKKKKEIKIVVRRQEAIVNTGPRQRRVEPEELAKALGAEICKEIPPRFRAAAAAAPWRRGK